MIGRGPIGERVAAVRNMAKVRAGALIAVLLAVVMLPAAAMAVTVDEIVTLSKAGVSEAVILALLDRDRTVLTIEPEQLVTLKSEGLSDTLLTAMLRSGRDEGDAAARADASMNAANILASLAMSAQPNPQIVIVGHGPDRPNTGSRGDDVDPTIRRGPIVPPYAHYGLPSRGGRGRRAHGVSRADAGGYAYRGDRLLCLAQVNTIAGRGPSFVTECPAVMQPPSLAELRRATAPKAISPPKAISAR
jgi:hypothetical protein